MIRAHFTSVSNKFDLRNKILEELDRVSQFAIDGPVEIRIFAFSFSDEDIFNKIISLVTVYANVTVKVVADWGLISDNGDQKVKQLATKEIDNLLVKYKLDQPYVWNEKKGKLEWSYHQSIGFLHHKMLSVNCNEIHKVLIVGSYNWTKKANANFENILVFYQSNEENACEARVFDEFNNEFEALWQSQVLTVDYHTAQAYYSRYFEQAKEGYDINSWDVFALRMKETEVADDSEAFAPSLNSLDWNYSSDCIVAFSSHGFPGNKAYRGFSRLNNSRRLLMMKRSGIEKSVPLTISTLTLDTLFRVKKGSTVRIAMYALSQRIPEFGILLEMSKAGIRIKMILDATICGKVYKRLLEQLGQNPKCLMEIRLSNRTMHQKYIIDTARGVVLTGTANLTTDSLFRHCEHRIRIENKALAEQFRTDFEMLWKSCSEKVNLV